MRNFYRLAAFLFLSVFATSFLFATDAQGQVELDIRFFDRRVYYVDTDPIQVHITITNNSPVPYRFKLAEDRAFSVDFDTRTMTNRPLSPADNLTRKRTQTNHIFFREIVIESFESFSFTEDLREFINFAQPGAYRVRARIFPELYRTTSIPIIAPLESNYLNLTLRPAVIPGPDGIPLQMDIATGAVLVRQPLPPDEVVTYMLRARQESQWERFFLYLDLETMLQRNSILNRRYRAENEAGRLRMVHEFRQMLQNSNEEDIILTPTTFDVLRTEYRGNRGVVVVMQRFRLPNFTQLREYTYELERRDNIWMIVNYSVQSMGSTAND